MLLNNDYDIKLRLDDVYDITIKYAGAPPNVTELERRKNIRRAILTLMDLSESGLEHTIQKYFATKVSIRPVVVLTEPFETANSAWDVIVDDWYGNGFAGIYMVIYLYKKHEHTDGGHSNTQR